MEIETSTGYLEIKQAPDKEIRIMSFGEPWLNKDQIIELIQHLQKLI